MSTCWRGCSYTNIWKQRQYVSCALEQKEGNIKHDRTWKVLKKKYSMNLMQQNKNYNFNYELELDSQPTKQNVTKLSSPFKETLHKHFAINLTVKNSVEKCRHSNIDSSCSIVAHQLMPNINQDSQKHFPFTQ